MKAYMLIVISICLFSCGYCLQPFEIKPKRVAERWTQLGVAEPTAPINLKIVISNRKESSFEEHALKIATPFSGYYRKHLTASQLKEWVSPSATDLDAVQQWLSGYGIQSEQRHDLVEATIPILKAQTLLNTTYHYYKDSQGRIVRRTEEYYIPEHLASIVKLVYPTVNFPNGKLNQKEQYVDAVNERSSVLNKRSSQDPCDLFLTTPACVNKVYNTTYIPPYSSNVTVEGFEVRGQAPNLTNLELYLKMFNPLPLKRKDYISFRSIGQPIQPPVPSDIYDTFVQAIMGHGGSLGASAVSIGGPAGTFFWGVTGQDTQVPPKHKLEEYEDVYVNYLQDLGQRVSVPAVISCSNYDHESDLSSKYIQYLCNIFARVGARGVSILNESGDDGSEALYTKNGTVTFQGNWPGSCPWVTSVGGTVWDRSDKTEKAATFQTRKIQGHMPGASAGTFSQVFPMPKYQEPFVPAYVKKYQLEEMYGPTSGNVSGFNSKGRGAPDIAVFGSRIPFIGRGKIFFGNGIAATSAPIAAGLMGRLNAYEQSKGRPPLGFLNSWFYQNPDLFNDITCCGNNGIVQFFKGYKPGSNPYGFPVAPGWDAVTGLGSFRFSKMHESLDSMAAAGALK